MKKINKYKIYPYIVLLSMLLLSALNFNLLMKPINFVTGGTPGLSILVEHVFSIKASDVILLIYIVSFILSYFILGKKSLLGVLIATIFYPLFVSLLDGITNYFVIDYSDLLIITIASGVLSGITNGFIYRYGFASSGLGILGPIFNKLFHLPIAFTNMVINLSIVLLGGYFFGMNMVLYAIIFIILNSFISNRIILGTSRNKAVIIVSKKMKDINNLLETKYNLESLVLEGNSKKNTILVLLPNSLYRNILGEIKKIDKEVFYNVLDAYEVKR